MAEQPTATELNLSAHREPLSVWNRPGWDGTRQAIPLPRWLIGVGGGALALAGVRRRSPGGAVLAGIGGLVAWWAIASGDFGHAWQHARHWIVMLGWGRDDRVQEESAQSFPASDAPSWTPTVGTGLRHRGRKR